VNIEVSNLGFKFGGQVDHSKSQPTDDKPHFKFLLLLLLLLLLTTTNNHFTALWILSGTTRVSQYQKKHYRLTLIVVINPLSLICFLQLLWSKASSSLFSLRACQSFCTISVHVFFGLPHGLVPSTSCCHISS